MSDDVLDRRMAVKCATCAFRPGTDAAKSRSTQLKAKLCIESGEEFLCHESPLPAWCAGVADALESRFEAGKEIEGGWRQQVRLALTEHICEIESDPLMGDDEMNRRLKDRLGKLCLKSAAT